MSKSTLELRIEYLKHKPVKWSSKERQKILEDFTYHTNKIEGLELNYGDTISFLRKGLIAKHSKASDLADLKNHREVLEMVMENYENLDFSVEAILDMHGKLMSDKLQWANYDSTNGAAGEFKRSNNYGSRDNGELKEYMYYTDVPRAMEVLVSDTKEGLKDETKALSVIHDFTYRFLNEIHPFWDGNGRMARLLQNLLYLKSGYPVVYVESEKKRELIESIIEQERDPASRAFHNFSEQLVRDGLEKSIKKAKKKD